MNVVDRVRAGLRLGESPEVAPTERLPDRPNGRWTWAGLPGGFRAGAISAFLTWVGVVVLVGLGWATSPVGNAQFSDALGLASAVWLLGHRVPLTLASGSISLAPLGLWLAAVWVTTATLARGRAAAPTESWGRFAGSALGGYAVPVALAALLTLFGGTRPVVLGLPLALGVPLTSLGLDLARSVVQSDPTLPEGFSRVPVWLVRALAPAGWGLATLGAMAGLVLLVALGFRWSAVTGLYSAVSPGILGGILLTLGQLLFLPNLGMWALAVLCGSGFQMAAGGTVSLAGSHPGLLPMLPILGLVPADGDYPAGARVLLAVPALAGAVIARRADRQWSRLGSWRGKAQTTAAAVVLCGIAAGMLTALASGSAGTGRLGRIGADPLTVAASVMGACLLGALVVLAWSGLSRRLGASPGG